MSADRPAVWVGHVALAAADPVASHDFYASLGMRSVHRSADSAILELRGGTHLLLFRGTPADGFAPFDLMVDDLEAVHAELLARGLAVTAVVRGGIHDQFLVQDPDGYAVLVQDSHAEGDV